MNWILLERGLNLLLDVIDVGREACARRRREQARAKAIGQISGKVAYEASRNVGARENAQKAAEKRFHNQS